MHSNYRKCFNENLHDLLWTYTSTSCCIVFKCMSNGKLKCSLTYLYNRNCPPCIWRDRSHQVAHSLWKTPARSWQQCPCTKHTFTSVHYNQQTEERLFWACEDLQSPVHEAFALQVRQRCAQLIGEQNQRGQVEVVLPYLQERPQLKWIKPFSMEISRWFQRV